jgi:hypothetical protein
MPTMCPTESVVSLPAEVRETGVSNQLNPDRPTRYVFAYLQLQRHSNHNSHAITSESPF